MKKIVITGGHLTPALAVIDELQRKGDWQILFIGRLHASEADKTPSVESLLIPKMGIEFCPITAGRVYREITLAAMASLLKIPIGFFQSLNVLARFHPQVILSFGGYLSVPVVLAGWLLRIPIITHEQTTVKGLATKFNTFFARIIAVSWPDTLKNFPKEKTILTGNPIRQTVFKNHSGFWKNLGFNKNLPLILVTGGNQGSHLINQTVAKILPKILVKANVFHLCGHLTIYRDLKNLESIKKSLPAELQSRYQVRPYVVGEKMGTLLNQADLVISRAGINTITELMNLGKPAILIPYPYLYQNEQGKNAQMMVNLGLALVIPEKELTGTSLYRLTMTMLKDLPKYQKQAPKAKGRLIPNAVEKIVETLQKLV